MFSTADHFDACCVDIHAGKTGNRFAALPIAQGLKTEFGATGADAGRGLTLHMDHGTSSSRKPTASSNVSTERRRRRPFTAVSSKMSRKIAWQSPRSRIVIVAIGVSKNWASCYPLKLVRLMPFERRSELQNRVQTIGAGTLCLPI